MKKKIGEGGIEDWGSSGPWSATDLICGGGFQGRLLDWTTV
jgi:hypothetical protein